MLKFLVLDKGVPARHWPIRNAYLLGADGNALRAEVSFDQGIINCSKREAGTAALAIQQAVGECGELTLQTCLLPERDDPYLLTLELARHRLMMLYNKLEDWGMFDLDEEHPVTKRTELARRLFIEALCQRNSDPPRADRLARECLVSAIDGSEELAVAHAELLLNRRKVTGALPRHPLGCGIGLDSAHERVRGGLLSNFDYIALPTPWRVLAPAESEYRWALMDNWTEWATRNRMPLVAGPVVSFEPSVLPDWLYIWEHDYDTVRDMIYEHVERIVTRYRGAVNAWTVCSGLHINSQFSFSFDQLIELTRMSTLLVKKIQPSARVLVEVRQPFGEYYSANQRSIPPLMYADLLVQGAIHFDALSVKLLMGQALPGQYTRDLMQISNLLDRFAGVGKPICLTVDVPSEMVTELMIAAPDPSQPVDPNCGHWRRPWSPLVQGRWLEAVMQIAMSKPFVEAVTWHQMLDHPDAQLPMGGLVNEDLQPKSAFRRLVSFRKALTNPQPLAAVQPGSAETPGESD